MFVFTKKLFAKRLKAYRWNRGWTQQQLADKSGVERIQICAYENERRLPSTESLVKLCLTLKITPNDLLCGPGRSKDRERRN